MTSDVWFDLAMVFFWKPMNDGQALHVTPQDTGGATSWGVVYHYWSAWRRQHGEDWGYNTFAKMPREGFLPYLYSQYWLACRCQDLNAVGLLVFDHAGMSGQGTAGKLLQRALGVQQDGAIGPATLAALGMVPQSTLIDRYTDARVAYLQGLAQAQHFTGWVPRAKRCRDYALQVLAKPPTAQPTAPPTA